MYVDYLLDDSLFILITHLIFWIYVNYLPDYFVPILLTYLDLD